MRRLSSRPLSATRLIRAASILKTLGGVRARVNTLYSMKRTSCVSALALLIFISACSPSSGALTADEKQRCQKPFQDVIDLTAPGLNETTISEKLVQAGEYFLNNCTQPNVPLSSQRTRLTELAQLAQVIPMSSTCAIRYTPTTTLADLDQNGTDELILHTQAIRCDLRSFRGSGGVSVVFRKDDLAADWKGTLIWPCFEGCASSGPWTQSPQPLVQVLPVHDSENRSFMLVVGDYLGGDNSGRYLNVWRWEHDGTPEMVLQVRLDDWCGASNSKAWQLTSEGSILIPEAPATFRCEKRDAVMYVLRGDKFEATKP
jgi:hypothetical protein